MIEKIKFMMVLLFSFAVLSQCTASEKYFGDDDDEKPDGSSWVELGFYSPIQLFTEETTVEVFRLSIVYTYNKKVNGYDVGILCDSADSNGVQFAGLNRTTGTMNGLSIGVANVAHKEMNGVQIALLFNQAGTDTEQEGTVRKECSSSGFQFSWTNCADGVFTGFQLGGFNISTTMLKGFQLGLLNIAERPLKEYEQFQTKEYKESKDNKTCLQIGIVNINSKGFLPFSFFINF